MLKNNGFIGSFKFTIIVGLLSLFGGPIGFIIFLCVAIPFHYFAIKRGILLAKAYVYLLSLSNDCSPEDANNIAKALDMDKFAPYAPVAVQHANIYYGGSQLTLIADARNKGFKS
jgi:hypothetical protein